MSNKNNRVCLVCGKQYRYCSHGCGADLDKPAWMASFDTYNCKEICNAFTGNTIGKFVSDEEAASKIRSLDTSNVESFTPKIKIWVKKMLAIPVNVENEQDMAETVEAKEANETVVKEETIGIEESKEESLKKYIGKKPFRNKNKSTENRFASLEND